ncbi:SLC13 family permease [Kordiimonas aquimaris]|uniref:SLC13 family permease n=1 Tax=Kordiimonas aquimaris TaxID=707591 RepID=UPI0021CE752B|nr:SLC13 family permease [Kordiimonas aquimaris]
MEIIEPTIQMWLTFAIVVGAIAAYSYDRIPLELSSIATVAILLILFEFMPLHGEDGSKIIGVRDILMGFADPSLITIMALLVVGQGLVQTGALNGPAQMLVGWGQNHPNTVLTVSFLVVMLISGIMNNTPVVVIFIPILASLADKLGKPPGQVMMPLSFAAILGGNMTKIGSSTNLLAAGAYEQVNGGTINFFDFTIPGAALAVVGFFYVIFVAPRLLEDRAGIAKRVAGSNGKQFLFQMELSYDNGMVGQTAIAGMFPGLKDVTVRMIQRGHQKLLPPYDDVTLQVGDIVMVAATRNVMTDILNASPDVVADAEGDDTNDEQAGKRRILAEAVIAPASRLDGRTLSQSGFRAETGCSVLGVQRRSRMIRAAISQLRMEAGDVLLLMGARDNILDLRSNQDVLLMESSATDVPMKEFAVRALMVFVGVVFTAALEIMPITVSALLGATMMMVLRCLNVRQASRAIDRRVFTIVGAALALGTAMQGTGGAEWLAQTAMNQMMGAPIWMILSGFFILVALLTNVLSNNATAVLFTPIAVSVAHTLEAPTMPFLLAVIFGANCSFATPMSYQTNLLVMAPGHYSFSDFMKVGTPLIFIMWIVFTLFVPWYYGLL